MPLKHKRNTATATATSQRSRLWPSDSKCKNSDSRLWASDSRPGASAGITLIVKVDPLVRIWLLAKNNQFPVIKFRQGDILYRFIHSWLQKSNRKTRLKYNPVESVSIYIPTSQYKSVYKSNHLSAYRQQMLNDYLYQAFRTEFYKHVIDKIEEGYSQRESILDYIDFYRLNDTIINFEMLKKAWDRSQDKTNYFEIVKNNKKILSYSIPIMLDFAFIYDYIITINCPCFINT